jgi:hypothetical protein
MRAKTRRRIYLREAVIMLGLARLAVRFIPAGRLFAWADARPRHINRFAAHEAKLISEAVETIAAKRWMNAPPLPRALAAHAMLRRRGIASLLCLGVAREGETLAAHAWVEFRQAAVIGGAEVPRVTRIAAFGGEEP